MKPRLYIVFPLLFAVFGYSAVDPWYTPKLPTPHAAVVQISYICNHWKEMNGGCVTYEVCVL
jgi:hypothetical protein